MNSQKSTLLRMDNVLLVVDDLKAAIAFFTELGLELEGETTVEGQSVDRLVGLDGVRSDIASMRTPDGHGRLELDKFHTPKAVRAEPEDVPVNTLGILASCLLSQTSTTSLLACRNKGPNSLARWCSTRTCTGSAICVAPRALLSRWPSSSVINRNRCFRKSLTREFAAKEYSMFTLEQINDINKKAIWLAQ